MMAGEIMRNTITSLGKAFQPGPLAEPSTPMDQEIDIEAFKLRLLVARQALLELTETRRQSSATVELDQSRTGRLSRMDAMQLQAMAQAGEQRAALALRRIEAALRRCETGGNTASAWNAKSPSR